ncbi:MAG: DUF6585 family protein [Chloroflexota bacterium]|nr:DUF6585 family protein [Chloroflexota bacterium]
MPPQKNIPLGSLTTLHHAQPLRWRDLLTTFIPLGLLVLSPLGYGLWRSYYGYTHFGVAAAASWGLPWYILSAVGSIPYLLYTFRRLRRAHLWVAVHAQGIRIHRPPNRLKTFPWKQIEGLGIATTQKTFLLWHAKPRHSLTIYAINTPPIQLNDRLPNLPELIASAKAQVYPRLRAQLREAYQAGQTLYFGVLTISKRGLSHKETTFSWSDIDQVSVKKGRFQILSILGKKTRIPAKNILNIELLIELLEEEVEP